MKIAFIDDFANKNMFGKYSNVIKFTNISARGNVIEETKDTKKLSHGTICGLVFCEYLRVEVEIVVINILDSLTLNSSVEELIDALNWCRDNDVDVINISAGTTLWNDSYKLKLCIDELVSKDVVVISSIANNGKITFPAFFRNIISVSAIGMDEFTPIYDIKCKVKECIELEDGNKIMIKPYNSYATPIVTANVCEIIKNSSRNIDKVMKILKQKYPCKDYLNQEYIYKLPIVYYDLPFLENYKGEIDTISKLMDYFDEKGYLGGVISQKFSTNYKKRIVSISEFDLVDMTSDQILPVLTMLSDLDFIIFEVSHDMIDQKFIKATNALISNNKELIDNWGNRETYIMNSRCNKGDLGRLLRKMTH
jgi:hypothetical protein